MLRRLCQSLVPAHVHPRDLARGSFGAAETYGTAQPTPKSWREPRAGSQCPWGPGCFVLLGTGGEL